MARKTYTEQFKRDAVKLMTEQGYSLTKASQALGVATALANWKRTLVPQEQSDLEAKNRRLREENRELRAEREILKKAATLLREGAAMKYAFVAEHRDRWPVRLQCRVLKVSASGYYDWLSREPGARARRRAELGERIAQIHADSRGTYGSPRVFNQLTREGERVGRNRVASIMREHEWQGKSPQKRMPRTTDSAHGKPVADNVIARDFTATAANQKWVADITYVDTDEGWLYLAAVMDCFSRRIVGWCAADHLRAELVEQALTEAIRSRDVPRDGALVHHSDRGVQYASGTFQTLLSEHGIVCSMSRKGDCYDNAAMESFFGTLKTELDEPLPTRAAARLALFDYIEVFYNRQRLHSTLGYISPAAYEAQHPAA
ncbi:MAG: IS3 family transposase [Phycisphaeraceae bacterium]